MNSCTTMQLFIVAKHSIKRRRFQVECQFSEGNIYVGTASQRAAYSFVQVQYARSITWDRRSGLIVYLASQQRDISSGDATGAGWWFVYVYFFVRVGLDLVRLAIFGGELRWADLIGLGCGGA